jgi:hypothetical protein
MMHLSNNEDDSLLGCCAVNLVEKFNDVSVVHAASIIRAMTALMMEAASTSSASVNFY